MSQHTSINGVAIYEAGKHPRDLRKAAVTVAGPIGPVEAEAKPAKAPKADKPAKENKKSK